jgi:hypothetical protein
LQKLYIIMNWVVVPAGGLKRQKHRLGHGSAGQHEALAKLEILEPTLFGDHAVLDRVELGHIAPALRIALMRSAEKPIAANISSVCCPTEGTSPIAASSSVKLKGGSSARTGPRSV